MIVAFADYCSVNTLSWLISSDHHNVTKIKLGQVVQECSHFSLCAQHRYA